MVLVSPNEKSLYDKTGDSCNCIGECGVIAKVIIEIGQSNSMAFGCSDCTGFQNNQYVDIYNVSLGHTTTQKLECGINTGGIVSGNRK